MFTCQAEKNEHFRITSQLDFYAEFLARISNVGGEGDSALYTNYQGDNS